MHATYRPLSLRLGPVQELCPIGIVEFETWITVGETIDAIGAHAASDALVYVISGDEQALQRLLCVGAQDESGCEKGCDHGERSRPASDNSSFSKIQAIEAWNEDILYFAKW